MQDSLFQFTFEIEVENLRKGPADWPGLLALFEKWNGTIGPAQIVPVVKEMKRRWFKFRKREVVYYRGTALRVKKMTILDGKGDIPMVHFVDGQAVLENDGQLMTEKEFKDHEAEQSRKRKEEEEAMRRREEERIKMEAAQRVQREEEERRRREEELARRRTVALDKCRVIYEQLLARCVVAKWKRQSVDLMECRKHYTIAPDDALLGEPTSLDQTVLLLQADSPQRPSSHGPPPQGFSARHNPRKRPSPDYDDSDPMSSSYVQPQKRPRISNHSNLSTFGVAWSRRDVAEVIYNRNAEAVDVMLANSNNEFRSMPIELVFNVVIATVPDGVDRDGSLSPLNALALRHFGCDPATQCEKRVSLHGDKRLNFCVLSDAKIRSFGATQPGAIRGFQGYVHLCTATAMMDFDDKAGRWTLHEEHRRALITALKRERPKMDGNRVLFHGESECAVVVLVWCQPLYTILRQNQAAVRTRIEFGEHDAMSIRGALGLDAVSTSNSLNSSHSSRSGEFGRIQILGVPSWPNASCRDTFKFAMDWMVAHSPPYPVVHRLKPDTFLKAVFERIFDSKALDDEQRISRWNVEVDRVSRAVLGGICNISWPPCSVDDRHPLVVNGVIAPSFWNNKATKQRIGDSLERLRITEQDQGLNPKQHIIRGIAALDGCWWTMGDVEKAAEQMAAESVASDLWDFDPLANHGLSDVLTPQSVRTVSSNRSTAHLAEFEQLVNDISCDFDSTLQGLQSCATVLDAVHTRIGNLQ